MAYDKQIWKSYDTSKSEEENIQNGAVGTAERLNHMESGIEATDQLADKHIKDKSNPHSTTATQVGLGSVSNYGIATTAEATAGTVNNKYMTPFLVSEALKSTKETLNKAQMSKVTANNGQAFMTITNATLLDSFVNQGPGFYTFVTGGTADAPPEVPIRGFVNMTREGIANVFAISDSGKYYFRFLENNKWKNDWQRLASASESHLYQSTLITTQDWDTIKQPGIYYVNGASGANKPDKATTMYGYLEVFSDGKTVLHRFNSFNDEICTRAYSGNPSIWKPWKAR